MQEFLDRFYNNLPRTPYSTDDFNKGMYINFKRECIDNAYIQFNRPNSTKYIVLDLDLNYHGSLCEIIYSKIGLPLPNLIIENIYSGRAHVIFELENAVHKNENSRLKPILFLNAIILALTKIYEADPKFVALICKNPLSKKWRLSQFRKQPYSLSELADKLDLNGINVKTYTSTEVNEYAEYGRNCNIFEKARQFAYSEVKNYRFNRDGIFRDVIYNYCQTLNTNFIHHYLTKS